MAEAGISADVLKSKIEQLLQTTYVEIEDMSGSSYSFHPAIYYPSIDVLLLIFCVANRGMWTSILGDHCVASIREEDYTGATSVG